MSAHVFRWDLDKTYLATEFDSVKDLVGSFLQAAEEKRNIPGTAALMRELRYGPDGVRTRIHVVSGSPRQMRRVLERKLQLDGADVDSLTLKPNLRNALRLRFRALRDQVGYKLPALLTSRVSLADDAMETCFGDDAEMDGMVYRLYSDICAGRVRGPELEAVIRAAKLYPDQAERIRAAAAQLPERDPVQRILIHLETGSPTIRFEALGPRVVPTFNTFQAALVLQADGRLTDQSVALVAAEMIDEYGYTPIRLAHSLEDLLRRGVIEPGPVEAVAERVGFVMPRPSSLGVPPVESPVDYLQMLDEIHAYQRGRKARLGRGRTGIERLLGGGG
ncbi:MAG: hypothetical protein ACI9WU_002826 [Myxococcota bacterium]|jgi:hypothetical protein